MKNIKIKNRKSENQTFWKLLELQNYVLSLILARFEQILICFNTYRIIRFVCTCLNINSNIVKEVIEV